MKKVLRSLKELSFTLILKYEDCSAQIYHSELN